MADKTQLSNSLLCDLPYLFLSRENEDLGTLGSSNQILTLLGSNLSSLY